MRSTRTRLGEIASQVVNDLKAPDVVLAQELEDQDICTVDRSWELVCGTTNNADGKPDTLQELTTKIYAQSGIKYDTAYDRDGADDRGIVNGYMFRMDRVELLPADAARSGARRRPDRSTTRAGLAFNTDIQNPKSLNAVLPGWVDTSTGVDGDNVFTRAPLVGHFRIWQEAVGLWPLHGRLSDRQPLQQQPGRPRRSADRAGELQRRDRCCVADG